MTADIDDALLQLLVCPSDRGSLTVVERDGRPALYNARLHRLYRIDDGIPVLLVDEAVEVDDAEHQQLMATARPARSR